MGIAYTHMHQRKKGGFHEDDRSYYYMRFAFALALYSGSIIATKRTWWDTLS
ncbi:hypothetical protein M8C21_014115, partial [Ambrosia artemisiifolia]